MTCANWNSMMSPRCIVPLDDKEAVLQRGFGLPAVDGHGDALALDPGRHEDGERALLFGFAGQNFKADSVLVRVTGGLLKRQRALGEARGHRAVPGDGDHQPVLAQEIAVLKGAGQPLAAPNRATPWSRPAVLEEDLVVGPHAVVDAEVAVFLIRQQAVEQDELRILQILGLAGQAPQAHSHGERIHDRASLRGLRAAEPVVILVVFGHRQPAIAPVEVFGEGQVFGVLLHARTSGGSRGW